ncbi:MAG: hypothetical protein IRZ33_05915 [Alicyclobacillaceae bacterium]|nr:hypothetical protein [Alicyclobacillaceae bacterium]
MKRSTRLRLEWIPYLLWAVFVNACNVWLITPLAQDYAVLGILAIFFVVVAWLTSVPAAGRRKWIPFTLFSLFAGQGFSSIAYYDWPSRVKLSLVIGLGLILVARVFASIRWSALVSSAAALWLANLYLPLADWSFFTHFRVAYYGRENVLPSDILALPFATVRTADGRMAIVTLTRAKENHTDVEAAVSAAGATPDDLAQVVGSFGHRYTLVEVSLKDGKFVQTPAPPAAVAQIDPNQLVSTFFPFARAYWAVEHGQVIQYMANSLSAVQLARLANAPAGYPANVLALAKRTEQQELADWGHLLDELGVTPSVAGLSVRDGRLTGVLAGRRVDVPVQTSAVIGVGSFTKPGTREVLLEGANELEIVSLDTPGGQVVSTYHGSADHPLPNDIRFGPIDNSGRDVIFVNAAPAFILKASATGPWQVVYEAPNTSFRFEGSVRWPPDQTPEIISDDPSYVRNVPTRYFTSYTYRSGELYRNWRVYHTNVVNVEPIQFDPHGPTYIVAAVYSTGKFFILQRHFVPVVPITAVVLGLVIVSGWVIRIRRRGGSVRTHA